ncbi:MAG: hypothetical protein J6M53_09200 [Bacteroidaceae bacterium]|nr:hypothetical protein [Bacteroidaceae bacterium]
MTAVQLQAMNTQIWHDMAELSDSEKLMSRVAKYLRRLVKEKNDPTLMTREEFFAKIDRAEEQYRRGEYTEQLPGESVEDMLKRCGYAV